MAEKQPMIVIKKITVQAAAAHGGSWKVAFADFMTAMMAFFLVMWLVNQSDEVKQNVSDYFSTPSIIEYNFSNYGVELTLEKLFLDLMNEPLRFFESFIRPVDKTPNIMMMGTKKIVMHHLAEQLGDLAQNVEISGSEVTFNLPDTALFQKGTAVPAAGFVDVMEKIKGLTEGLEDSNIYIDSGYKYSKNISSLTKKAQNIAEKRLDLISAKVELGLENETVDIFGKVDLKKAAKVKDYNTGFIKFRLKQKDTLSDGRKPRKIEGTFEAKDESMSVYDNFVDKLSKKEKAQKKL